MKAFNIRTDEYIESIIREVIIKVSTSSWDETQSGKHDTILTEIPNTEDNLNYSLGKVLFVRNKGFVSSIELIEGVHDLQPKCSASKIEFGFTFDLAKALQFDGGYKLHHLQSKCPYKGMYFADLKSSSYRENGRLERYPAIAAIEECLDQENKVFVTAA